MIKPFLLKFLLLLLIPFGIFAQTLPPVSEITDKQVDEIIQQISTRGLSESELEILAKSKGYSDSDILILKERIEKRRAGFVPKNNVNNNAIVREQMGELSERVENQDTTEKVKKTLFGSNLFNNKKLDFSPNLNVPTPPDYILGANDEIIVAISGYAVGSYDLKVSPEGNVRIENLAPIYVNGLTVSQAKEKIKSRLSSLYAGLKNGTLQLDVTLSKVKTIRVTVVGEITNPGSYAVSSLSTLFNALYLSGGPSNSGSFRNIQLLRNNKIVQILDLYDFLLTGTLKGNVNLKDGDVVFVPVVGSVVEFAGEVRRPMLFELKNGESILDGIHYAGGFTEKAFSNQVTVTRLTKSEKEILNVSEKEFSNTLLRNGDILEVGAILDRYANRVEVQGAVFRPGTFALGQTIKSVADLIKAAEGLREDAHRKRAIVRRLGANLDPQFIAVNLDSVLNGYDVVLQREDVLMIKSIVELREAREVKISGKVNIPGDYAYVDNMSVKDLIFLAGGLREGASPHTIEIARRLDGSKSEDKDVEIINIDLVNDANQTLMPFDIVVVRELPNYQPQQMVSIIGEINYPGTYGIANRTERISDLIDRAGGFRDEAYIKGAKFFREGKQVALDFEKLMKNKEKAINLFLKEGDRIEIPKEEQTVKVIGEVMNPTSVAYQEKLSFRDYIIQAGGYTDSAFVKKVYVKYPNGHVDKTRSFLTGRFYPSVEKGMEIIVPVKNRKTLTKPEIFALSSSMISLSAVVISLLRIL